MPNTEGQSGAAGGQTAADPASHQIINYTVNAEAQTTTERKLTVRTILTNAGFTPVEQWQLTRNTGNHTYQRLDEEIPLHEGESFTATFTGPTQTS